MLPGKEGSHPFMNAPNIQARKPIAYSPHHGRACIKSPATDDQDFVTAGACKLLTKRDESSLKGGSRLEVGITIETSIIKPQCMIPILYMSDLTRKYYRPSIYPHYTSCRVYDLL